MGNNKELRKVDYKFTEQYNTLRTPPYAPTHPSIPSSVTIALMQCYNTVHLVVE
jgi:hypothetical protein